MRVFLAGASGVMGRRLVPLAVEAGHTVAGLEPRVHIDEAARRTLEALEAPRGSVLTLVERD